MWSRFQTGVRGNPAGYLQAWPRTWTRDYWEQIQLAVRAGLELGASELQVQRSNRSATLQNNAYVLDAYTDHICKAWYSALIRWQPYKLIKTLDLH